MFDVSQKHTHAYICMHTYITHTYTYAHIEGSKVVVPYVRFEAYYGSEEAGPLKLYGNREISKFLLFRHFPRTVNPEIHIVVFQVEVYWVMRPCSFVVGYRRFGNPCCLRPVCCDAV
jgi:hypothetical protein